MRGRLCFLIAILTQALSRRSAHIHAEGKPLARIMAEHDPTPEQLAAIAAENESAEMVNYRAPAQKSLQEIHELDRNDESLRKYKEALLGSESVPEADPDVPNVQVTQLTLVCEAAPDALTIDLQEDLEPLKKQFFVLKEGVEYRIKINFKVNREIVSGLKYIQETFRKGVKIDKSAYMVGSYGPRPAEYEFLTPLEEAPKGMLARGTYNIRSHFSDDDKHDHLSWQWTLDIKKDWTD
ncbi:rho GDP-dissociation inhibitor 1-like isoform X2 [Paramormyrops kingsleyae]|uniref:Rho GDP-dissociation inhibitor 1 n=1 Tax=Paramormyrops kingsleyae TaxID=1676925 RepID=A0A3B3RZT5_9TELE|nr:rho GDP-dissociation inhibitor 1-like isoform X2 [Paramormyrops kingsleyae]